MLGIGIIGCGLIGQKRAKALGNSWKLVACADIDIKRAQNLAGSKCQAFNNWNDLLALPEVDAVVIATLHDSLVTIAAAAICAGKHVLVEKPAARNPHELEPLLELQARHHVKVRVGFNHRYHHAMQKAKDLIASGDIGELMFLRARYGHGGRLGYDREWRANPVLSGGGELIDQGPHLIDLSRWFMKEEFPNVQGVAQTCYWDMPVDDNAFMILKTAKSQVAFLHASCSEWKNTFSMEIYGRKGKIDINGLGGSYGVERITLYKMLAEMGPPDTTTWEFPRGDNSWELELSEFYNDIQLDREPIPGLIDAHEALKIVQTIYKESGYDYCT